MQPTVPSDTEPLLPVASPPPSSPSPRFSRRMLIAGTVAGVTTLGAGVALARRIQYDGLPDFLLGPATSQERDSAWHWMNRLGFGARADELNHIAKLGLERYLEQQLDPASIDDSACDRLLASYRTLSMNYPSMLKLGDSGYDDVSAELDRAVIVRAVYSKRQLFEVMVNFWSDHFTIWHDKDLCPYFKTIDDREVIRKHALGNFRDLLGASAHSPAMLDYLDNITSEKDHPNENYARELLELHTLSPGHYSEKDVKELARALTGWIYIIDESEPKNGSFIFDASIHDTGTKTILGHTIAPAGEKEVEQVLDILATHPATADFIAHKLCRRFISDSPPDAIVKAAAATFRQTKGDIRAVLRTIILSDTFRTAPPKYRRPFESLIALMRAADASLMLKKEGPDTILYALDTLRHHPFQHRTPEGYGDTSGHWNSALLPRWNTTIALLGTSDDTVHIDMLAAAQKAGAKTPEAILDHVAFLMTGQHLAADDIGKLIAYLNANDPLDLTTDTGKQLIQNAISIVAISPAAQFR